MAPEGASLPSWFLPLMGGIFAAAGAIVFLARARIQARHADALQWPFTSGRIIASSVSRNETSGEEGTHVQHHCDLRYEYSINGVPFEGTRLAIGGSAGDEAGANEEFRRYPAGTPVVVYYNPKNPADAVIERSVAPRNAREPRS